MKNQHTFTKLLLSASILAMAPSVFAQDSDPDEVIATGIRQTLQNALIEKREADSLIEVILAEDIGKLPDQNLAEVLENITGVQITRTAGVGTGVQIRGSNENRIEINGVSSVGSGAGRTGVNFEDISSSVIAGLEVIKSPEAKTIEGSVGGTVNLRTIRPLDLNGPLISARVQAENSSLSSEGGWTPRFSGSLGKKWENASGQEIGVVISGAYTEQEATSFRPRVDRDGSLVENVNVGTAQGAREDAVDRPAAQEFDFLGIQFLNQELENFEFDTLNLVGSVEAQVSPNVKLYFDGIYTDQERRNDSTRVQGSGVSVVLNNNVPTSFETVDFGSLGGSDLGSIQAALTGTIQPSFNGPVQDSDDPNLRFNSDTGARVTDSTIIRIGGEWEKGDLWARAEFSTASSDSERPGLNSQFNFINPNPNVPFPNVPFVTADGSTLTATRNENSVPFIFDLRDEALTFGIDFDSPFAPTVAQLLDPANIAFDQVDIDLDTNDNSEDAVRFDFEYNLAEKTPFFSSIEAGYRYSEVESSFTEVDERLGLTNFSDSPLGTAFGDLIVPGPDNFDESDGRALALRNFLIIDPDRAFNDRDAVINTIFAAVLAQNPDNNIPSLETDQSAFFDIAEQTHAIYGQLNFEAEDFAVPIRGNIGLRYIDTEIDSTAFEEINGVSNLATVSGSYDFFLPRVNLIANVTDDIQLRGAWTRDLRRPDFTTLNSTVTFATNENQAVSRGNPNLEPEEIETFDVSAEWFFAPAAVFSIGYFHKDRTNLIGSITEDAAVDGQNNRETDPTCPGGGIFNPVAETNSFGPANTTGICVDFSTQFNDAATTTQEGIEVAFQYDLSNWEDRLGSWDWASGFGIAANYTYQTFSGGSTVDDLATRGVDIINAIDGIFDPDQFVQVEAVRPLLDFSENAYNITGYYEKFGLSARLRYTWRDAFRTLDTAAGASLNSTLGFPVVTASRGQLNGSINYDITDQFSIGVEAVNITESDVTQFCVNDGALLCAQGIADRRVIVGGSYTF